jgi:hypothetical protein
MYIIYKIVCSAIVATLLGVRAQHGCLSARFYLTLAHLAILSTPTLKHIKSPHVSAINNFNYKNLYFISKRLFETRFVNRIRSWRVYNKDEKCVWIFAFTYREIQNINIKIAILIKLTPIFWLEQGATGPHKVGPCAARLGLTVGVSATLLVA